jgi:hypothetical protein
MDSMRLERRNTIDSGECHWMKILVRRFTSLTPIFATQEVDPEGVALRHYS